MLISLLCCRCQFSLFRFPRVNLIHMTCDPRKGNSSTMHILVVLHRYHSDAMSVENQESVWATGHMTKCIMSYIQLVL